MATVSEVRDYLNSKADRFKIFDDKKIHKVNPLSGGISNFVYRIYITDNNDTDNDNDNISSSTPTSISTVILKFYPEYSARTKTKQKAYPQFRYHAEKEALVLVSQHLSSSTISHIRVPRIIDY